VAPPPKRRGRGALPATLLTLLVLAAPPARAQNDSIEFAVKATYLYKFAPFIDWPDAAFQSPASPFVICVVGDDPFGQVLDRAVVGQRFGEHPIMVERIATYGAERACHVLYTIGSDAQPAGEALAQAAARPVLTVTDAVRASSGKGIIHFVVQENRVRFEIDDRAAAQNGLRISSKLLSLATAVRAR